MAFILPDVKIDFKELISAFTIPTDIKDDLVYCQKSIRQYIKVHQIVARLGTKVQSQIIRMRLDDLEKEICEISFEQKSLLIRLRQSLHDYYNSIKSDNIDIKPDIGNNYVSHQLKLCIENENYEIHPTSVKRRYTEKELMIKYGLEEDYTKSNESSETLQNSTNLIAGINSKQISLLKPKSERFALQNYHTNGNFGDNKSFYSYKNSIADTNNSIDIKPTVSRTINSSRLNLLQALNKAKNQSLLKNKKPIKSQLSSSSTSPDKDKYDSNSPQSLSTSDDSSSEQRAKSRISHDSDVPNPKELDQESFLKIFGLYTHAQKNVMLQRRSKRRRRNVHSNEKSDFHYGNLDLYDRMNKKKKQFLYSPPATRSLKRKRNDPASKTIVINRSSSSSPDLKHICNECSKNGERLFECEMCSGHYHLKCHRGPLSKQPLKVREKICPKCQRKKLKEISAEEENQLRELKACNQLKLQNIELRQNQKILWDQLLKFNEKFHDVRTRRRELLKQSKVTKTKMNYFLNIVEDFKE